MAHSTSSGIQASLSELIALREEAHRLDIAPRSKVLATRSGGHLSRFRGRGMEFDESRVYQAGDDIRNMDWRVTARAGIPHVKLFREERERPMWLLVDMGPSMRFGTRVAFKSVVAARAAALLAWAAADKTDRVGGLVFNEAQHFEQRPAARTHGLLPLLNALARLSSPPASSAGVQSAWSRRSEGTNAQGSLRSRPSGEGGHAGITEAAEKLVRLVRPGSLVFLLSDFAGVSTQRSAWLAQLAEGNEVVLVHVLDPLEQFAPPPGRYAVTDGKRRGLLDTEGGDRRETWHQRFVEHAALIEGLARRHRAHVLRLRCDEAVGPALSRGLRPRRGLERR